jgi:hypothetical protein
MDSETKTYNVTTTVNMTTTIKACIVTTDNEPFCDAELTYHGLSESSMQELNTELKKFITKCVALGAQVVNGVLMVSGVPYENLLAIENEWIELQKNLLALGQAKLEKK